MFKKSLGICDRCNKWSHEPSGFRETKHFIRCPCCGKSMKLLRGFEPMEIGLALRNKVEAGLMPQSV